MTTRQRGWVNITESFWLSLHRIQGLVQLLYKDGFILESQIDATMRRMVLFALQQWTDNQEGSYVFKVLKLLQSTQTSMSAYQIHEQLGIDLKCVHTACQSLHSRGYLRLDRKHFKKFYRFSV